MFKWNETIQKMFVTEVEVECARCGADFKVPRFDIETKKVLVCRKCIKEVVQKYNRRKKEAKGRGLVGPYQKPVFA